MLRRKAPEEIPEHLAYCVVAFLSLSDNSLFAMTISAKLQLYMACGMPIIAVAVGELKRIIEEAECGWVAPMAIWSKPSLLRRRQLKVKSLCSIG